MTVDPTRAEKMDPARLMAAIHDDDPAAFAELYRAYLPSLCRGVRAFIRKLPRLQPFEDDIVSRAWVRLLARDRKLLRSYDPKRASFAYFMSMIGANTAWQLAARKEHSQRLRIDELDERALAELASCADMESIVVDRELLSKLDEQIQRVASERELRLLEEVLILQRPAKEVAEELGVSVEVVWAATSRLRKKLESLARELSYELSHPSRASGRALEALLVCLAVARPAAASSQPSPSLEAAAFGQDGEG